MCLRKCVGMQGWRPLSSVTEQRLFYVPDGRNAQQHGLNGLRRRNLIRQGLTPLCRYRVAVPSTCIHRARTFDVQRGREFIACSRKAVVSNARGFGSKQLLQPAESRSYGAFGGVPLGPRICCGPCAMRVWRAAERRTPAPCDAGSRQRSIRSRPPFRGLRERR